jgi:hypothetical protein
MPVVGSVRVDLGLNSAEFESGMNKVKGSLAGIGKAFAALGGVAVFAAFSAGIGQAMGRIEETRKLTAQLDRALENTGNTARTSGKEIADFADQLERSTGRAAEEVLAVGTNLATFGFSREVFFDAIKLADDMSAAWGGDLKQNVEGLARALADPEKGLAMLTKRGITFTDEQKKMIAGFMKANDIIGAQGVVMDALNEQVKGVAASGFTGLTKAQANATLAMETFFETMANAMGINSGMEKSLTAVAAALDFVSQNFDVIARAAGVAGAAILTALGPTIWAGISTAAGLMVTTVISGIRAIGIAIAANPIGFIIMALASAVTAAFLFRDEIKQAIGIDFVGIIQAAANNTIGLMVGAYKAVVAGWSLLPAAFGDIFTRAMNGSIAIVQNGVNGIIGALRNIPGLDGLADTDLSGFMREESGALGNLGGAVQAAFSEGFSVDYLGELGKALGLVGDEATGATANIAGLATALDGGGTGGAKGSAKAAADAMKKLAAEGQAVFDATRTSAEKYAIEIERLNRLLQAGAIDQDTYNRAVLQAQTAFDQIGKLGGQVTSTLQSGFADMFKGLVTGTGNAMDAISQLLGKLADLFIDQAFNMLFSGGGVGGGLGGLFSGIGKLFGFARGGTIMPGGSGGIDSQLVTFRKSPNERVDITKPGQTLTGGGGGEIHVNATITVENGNIVPLVTQVSGQVAGQQIKQNNKQLPSIMQDIQMRQG